MNEVKRKVTYRLYPTGKQEEKLFTIFELHRALYNAALEQRIDAYRRCGISLSFSQQCRELTELRRDNIDYRAINAQSAQVTLKRLDLGFYHFFGRVKRKEARAGFPRFKSRDRFSGWGYKTHGDGWKLNGVENGKIRISGIGEIRVRGKGRFGGNAKTVEINRKGDRWYASVTFELKELPLRRSGTKAIGIDWGLKPFTKIVEGDGTVREIENPRTLSNSLKQLKQAQKKLSKKKKGSKNRKRARKKVTRLHEKISNQRKEFLHQTSCGLIEQSSLICTEQLNVKQMTQKGGAYKRGLNRSILDT